MPSLCDGDAAGKHGQALARAAAPLLPETMRDEGCSCR
jgi:hypothetical protein